ncbi:hypothetical protein Tco_0748520 [Tanacetum coccineum]|uniref:Uncharacterized protein n=1 Tax=Tanacetum coccineum TaxID=301880 RepID=A0ABQ4YVV1_9ASTR
MENASNQDEGKAVDNVVSNHGNAVDNIDTQILNAFMEVDPVFNPASMDVDVELYVALSRGISRTTTKVLVKPKQEFDQRGVYTSNVVYQEVLRDE